MASPVICVTPTGEEFKDRQIAQDDPNNVKFVATLDEGEGVSSQKRQSRSTSKAGCLTGDSAPFIIRTPASARLSSSPLLSGRSTTEPSTSSALEDIASPSAESVGSSQPSIFSGPPTASTPGSLDWGTDLLVPREKYRDESPTRQLLNRRDFFRENIISSGKVPISSMTALDGADDSEDNNYALSDASDGSDYHPRGQDGPENYTKCGYSDGNGIVFNDDTIDQSFSGEVQESEAQHAKAEEPLQTAKQPRAMKPSRAAKQPRAMKQTTALKPTLATINPTMTFTKAAIKQHGKAREGTLKFLRCAAGVRSIKPGFVYCFSEKATPGHVKVGYASIENLDAKYLDERAFHIDAENDENVKRRLSSWAKKCFLDVRFEFAMFMPCAAAKMERFIHRTLHEHHRFARCRKSVCKTNHPEWFEMSVIDARSTVEKWQRFSMLKPYDNTYGSIESIWCTLVFDHCGQHYDLTIAQWVDEHLPKLIEKREGELLRLKIREELIEKSEKELEGLRLRERELRERGDKLLSELSGIQRELTDVQNQKEELEKEKSRA